MEHILVVLIVASAALYLLGRMRRTLSGKGGCGCGCSGRKGLPMASACAGCSPKLRENCGQKPSV